MNETLNSADAEPISLFTNGGRVPNAAYALFEPELDELTGELKDLRDSYPQLKQVPEFEPLTFADLHFVNAYANPTSPLVVDNVPDTERVVLALEYAYGDSLGDEQRDTYILHQWPEEVGIAIQRMKRFNVANRVKASNVLEDSFNNLIIVNKRVQDMMQGGTELSKKYIQNMIITKFRTALGNPHYELADNERKLIEIIAGVIDERFVELDNVDKFLNIIKKVTPVISETLEQMEKTGVKKKETGRRDIFSDVRKKMARA